MEKYLDALRYVLENGVDRDDRTGTGTRAVFGMQLRFAMNDGFPAVTTKKLFFRAVKSELLWFLEGSDDERRLAEIHHGTRDSEKKTIWTGNAQADYWNPHSEFDGHVGKIYGVQWRKWKSSDGKEIDQIKDAIRKIKEGESFKRRLIVTAWHPGELDYDEQQPPKAALSPCHILFQFFVADGRLSLQMYQRSADMFLGVPFNIASYSLLLHMMAQVCGLEPGEFIHVLGDAHVYKNHFDQVREQLERKPYPLPKLELSPGIRNIDDFTMDDIRLKGYKYHPPIKAPMAV